MRLGRAVAGEWGGMPWIVVVVVEALRERDEGMTRRPDHENEEEEGWLKDATPPIMTMTVDTIADNNFFICS